MADSNNAEFNPRALNDEFLAKFKTGIHKAVLDEVKKDNELNMCLRGTYVTIYYKSLQILKLHNTSRLEINSKYGINPKDKEYGYPNDFNAYKYFAEAKKKLSEYQPKSGHKQNKKEKEVQQAIVNKYNSEQNNPDLFILDIEYRQKCPLSQRFDAIAAFKDENNQSRLAFVEIKCGSGAISGTSGVKGHFESARKFVNHLKDNKKYGESFYQDMKSIINQLNELGLYKNKFDGKTDFIEKPELIYIFVNYSPRNDIIGSITEEKGPFNKITCIDFDYDGKLHLKSVQKRLCRGNYEG